MIRQVFLWAAALVLLAFAAGRIRRALASDEQTLRWTLEELREDFNSGDVGSVASGFHPDFFDESSGADFEATGNALRALYFQERSKDGFLLRVELPEDLLSVEVVEGADRAKVEATAQFSRLQDGHPEPWWDAKATITFARHGGAWRILRSERVNHSARR